MTASTETRALTSLLFKKLKEAGVGSCHWKSNWRRVEGDAQDDDFDLLIRKGDGARFEQILGELGFSVALPRRGNSTPGIVHYIGFDPSSGSLVHLHVFFELRTGGLLFKGYRLPHEDTFFQRNEYFGEIPLPARDVELMTFIVRKALECGSLGEIALLWRERAGVRKEIHFLYSPVNAERSEKLFVQYYGQENLQIYRACLKVAASSRWSVLQLVRLGIRMKQVMEPHAVCSQFTMMFKRLSATYGLVLGKLWPGSSHLCPIQGGKLIAFVGCEGAGKSSLLGESLKWLRPEFAVGTFHAGRPPATFLTFIPRLFLPLLRKKFHRHRLNVVEREINKPGEDYQSQTQQPSLMYMIRSVMVTYDQLSAIRRGYRLARDGWIVLSDRFPSRELGGMDGPRIDPNQLRNSGILIRYLAQLERYLYNLVPRPDCVLYLDVPLDIALSRNARRAKVESPDAVRLRHGLMPKWKLPGVPLYKVINDKELENVLPLVKELIWGVLHTRAFPKHIGEKDREVKTA